MPTAIPGNLLALQTSAVDPSTFSWQARTNCTISLGSGGRNGDGCLKLTSLAAGEMQAQTAVAYPVTAGQTYWTFADASGATVPERIGIQWLTDANVAVGSITWSLTTASASASWHRISVAGVAPLGATRARIIVSAMTPAAAGVLNYFENVYLGLPLRFPGNLLSFNAEAGAELDLTAWGVETNCAISRVAPVTTWPYDYWYAGGHQIALTVTANGSASILCVERPPVTAGTEYVATAYLNPPTSGSSVWVELRFYDAGGSQVAAARSTLAAPGTGWYRQIASGVAPAGAVTASIAVGITSGTAAQVVRTEGAYLATVAVAAAGTIRTDSVLPMADWDFEMGVGQWAKNSGVATIARSTPWGAMAGFDFYSLTVTSSTATASVLLSGIYPVDPTAGASWRTEVYARVTAGGWAYVLGVRWLDAGGTLISTSTVASATVPGSGWWLLAADYTIPANAASAQLEYTLTATSAPSALALDRPALWPTLPLISAETVDDEALVQVTLRELDVGETVTLWRVTPDGARTLVRARDGLLEGVTIVGDAMLVEDYEAPLGTPVYYRAEIRLSTGALNENRTSETVTLAAGDRNYAWLTDPARPGIGVRVLVKEAPAWKQAIEQAVYRVRGRPDPVILSDTRGSREGDLVCWTQTDEEREALRFLLASGNIVLWRSAPDMGEPDVYVSVAETAHPRVVPYGREQWREWTLPITEVAIPTGGQVGSATWTVHDVVVEFATGYEVLDAYATVFDLATDQRRS